MNNRILIVMVALVLTVTSVLAEDMPVIEWTTHAPEPVLLTGEIPDSWEEIIAYIDDGTIRQRYAVGTTKELDLGELGVIHMQLAGFDLDERADGPGKAATTWIALEILPEKQPMNLSDTNDGGWRDSDLRAFLRNSVRSALPSVIREHLVVVVKTQEENNGIAQTTSDEIWIPDKEELFENTSRYSDLFKNLNANRTKYCRGSATWWWLRSAYGYDYFMSVDYYGLSNYSISAISGGVALGFCL